MNPNEPDDPKMKLKPIPIKPISWDEIKPVFLDDVKITQPFRFWTHQHPKIERQPINELVHILPDADNRFRYIEID